MIRRTNTRISQRAASDVYQVDTRYDSRIYGTAVLGYRRGYYRKTPGVIKCQAQTVPGSWYWYHTRTKALLVRGIGRVRVRARVRVGKVRVRYAEDER